MTSRMIRLALALAAMVTSAPAFAAEPGLRPEVGKPLQAAQEAIRQQKFRDALTRIKEAEAAGSLTSQESAVIEQLRGIAASGAGDSLVAARAFEAAIASGQLSQADQARLTLAVGSLYYQGRDYPRAVTWLRKAIDAGGGDNQTRTLLAQAYYLTENYADAVKILKDLTSATEPPSEALLQLLANAELKRNNPDGYDSALAALARYYPKPEYWSPLIQRVQAQPGFATRLSLDVLRLNQATGTLATAAQYTEAAELALQSGLPAEAKGFLDKGFAVGVLGSGPDAERHKRLRALAEQKSAADRNTLLQSEAEARTAKDGNALANTGLAFLGHGQAQKAAQLIESGLTAGGIRNADDARLHLGIAYLAAGDRDKAAQAFKSVQGKDGSQELARLWLLQTAQGFKG